MKEGRERDPDSVLTSLRPLLYLTPRVLKWNAEYFLKKSAEWELTADGYERSFGVGGNFLKRCSDNFTTSEIYKKYWILHLGGIYDMEITPQ